jgi:thiol-disulfide isomerase/thioredoxin
MKLLFSLFLALGMSVSAIAQSDSLPYQRFPTLPPLQLLLTDSSTLFTKEKLSSKMGTLVIFFSPGCSHCQHMTTELLAYKDSLPRVQLVMASFASITEIRDFQSKYHTDSLPNITIGKDINFLLPPFYGINHLPFIAFYNRKGVLGEIIDGNMSVPKVMDRVRELSDRRK